ncbi:alpha-protein kinase 3 isoform X2 [Seriola lalandi dorsalis]|uniref:alpha-protein kinase 3 isoform X2 n=1 Tax=Seriola lalandi dorsalis TaxID=1841481 RepID=UPI000C6FC412|nr:alpha-protein kinase 3 isoform X2 [Seriola lalandi dorsalis]
MGSRRTTPRSTSWNGGSSNGDDSGGTSRPGGCSYLSNVRPENRSTLCSVMAQLTEETQPAFQTTLKSKAVSENCNVKFSCVVTGYPAPQVNWYKDDMQLDRYCGLPKYEIFRNGQNHSLHIYNCTVEDAAIYQASAINSKGIVSCSGVLEVGEMNEFKIHQRYFAKLKQKAEHRRREAEGKENQEPLRTISPDRTQRKRRSTMEAFLSMPSSMEDESNEESPQAVAVGTEDRLQEATVEEVEEKPVTNGQVINENGNSGGTYIYDSAQKIFTAHQPKTPFVKKKIKISNIAKVAKADTLGERVSEERRAKDETSASVALACIDPVQSEGNSEEVMEVEKLVSSTVDSDSRNVTEQCKKSTTEEAMLVERPSKDENVCVTPSQSTVSPAALIYTSHTVSGTGGKQAAKSEKEVGHKDREENFEMQKQSPYLNITSTQVQSSVASTPIILKEDIIKTEEATAMDTDEKSDTSTGGSLAHRDLKSVDTACESRTALPQHPCGRARDQLSDKETSPCQENVSEPRPAPLREVTQAHTKMNRNDAPVNLELPRAQRTMDAQPPQKTPSESKATTDDIQTPFLHCGLQAAIDKMTQDTWDHSRGSNESPMVLFTDLQKSPFESPGAGENTPGCNVSPTAPQSQVDTAIKTVEGTEIQADEEVEGNKLELASGARRKILTPKAKPKEATEATSPVDNQAQKKEVSTQSSKLSTSPLTPSVSPSLSRRSHLLQPAGEQTSPVERRSPLLSRRKTALETQAPSQQPTDEISSLKTEGKPTEKDKHNPFKAPQVIRKIRGETFADTSGHLKLWCQFFNVLSDSTIKWYKNEEEIAQIKRNAGDETQVNLAIVQASCSDSGVYGCSITNEYGTDSTDTLLSTDILAGMSLREDLGVGEEIEMTPLIFSKGVADSGIWANKLFGRIMMQESHIGDGCSHKVWRAKVIYGLEPVFESGNTCIIKVRNPIAYGGKEESCLVERNLDIVKQECKIQNLAREYCKIFSAEARVIENFGPSLEVLPVYLMYRPANTVPYATVEADLTGVYQKYSVLDHTGRIDVRTGSVVEQKCCALQHWIFQWTNGNLLLTRLEGVDTKITNVGISVKSTGHQGLCVEGNPKVFEQFVSQHQCNYFCGLLGLRSLKVMDSLLTPTKPKGSRSPLLQRKMAAGSSSPQTGRKAAGSPRMPRKAEPEGRMTPTKQKAADAPKVVKMA